MQVLSYVSRLDALHANISGLAFYVLAVRRAFDNAVVRLATAGGVDNDGAVEVLAQILKYVEQFNVNSIKAAAAFALKF